MYVAQADFELLILVSLLRAGITGVLHMPA
jgi:hypothetical protein